MTNTARDYLPTTNGTTSKQRGKKERKKRNPNGRRRKATKENVYYIKRLGKQGYLLRFNIFIIFLKLVLK